MMEAMKVTAQWSESFPANATPAERSSSEASIDPIIVLGKVCNGG
jgi:hypothetical protein